MHFVEPKVYMIGKSVLQPEEARRWLDELGAGDFTVPEGTEGEQLATLAGKRCYMSFQPGLNPNVTRVRQDVAAFIGNILASRHGSVIEHVTYTFAIENVSRVFTAEMNRHRAGWAVSEGSLRYIRFTDIPVWLPLSMRDAEGDPPEVLAAKQKSREIFERAFLQMEENYRELEAVWQVDQMKAFEQKKKITSAMRRIIGMGVATGGVWTGNLRALRHVLAMRIDAGAEEEIAYVFTLILKMLLEQEPNFFGDFRPTEDGFWKPEHWKI